MKNGMVRVAIAALVGGIIWFVWGTLIHTVIFGHENYNKLPNEAQVSETLRAGGQPDGVYWLPWFDESKMSDPAAEKAYDELLRKGPVAMIVYRKSVESSAMTGMMVCEFLSGLAASIMIAILLNRRQWHPVRAAAVLFIVSVSYWLSCNFSDWIWYGYPWSWVQVVLIEQSFGWAMAGCAMAAIVRTRRGSAR
ncbi:MAG: hypothetical protein K8R92_08990 [Planctomycetes bacterium]|nr:hypothetical protein [Planctomycetota bacterium]